MGSIEAISEMVRLERFTNDGSPTGLTWVNSSSVATCPRKSGALYALPLLRLEAEACETLGEIPIPFRHAGNLLVPIHPDCVHVLAPDLHRKLISNPGDMLLVAPTASPRTVYSKGEGWHGFLKLDYPFTLGRFPRELNGQKLFQGIRVSEALRRAGAHRDGIFHFAEIAGIEFDSTQARRSGALFRDGKPFEAEFDTYIAFCSLFARDFFDENKEPLLIVLARRYGGAGWIAQQILIPLLRSFWALVFDHHLWPEPHAQNIVLGLSPDGATGIIWRDCQGFSAEATVNEFLKMNMRRILNGYEGAQRRSYLYDAMLGGYVFDPLLELTELEFTGSREALREMIVAETRAWLGRYGGEDIFPREGTFAMSLAAPTGSHLPLTLAGAPRYR